MGHTRLNKNHTAIENAGWHMSFFSDADGVLTKMGAFAHQEYNTPEWRDKNAVETAIENGIDYFNLDEEPRLGGLARNPSCENLPVYVMENQERFKNWLPAGGCVVLPYG